VSLDPATQLLRAPLALAVLHLIEERAIPLGRAVDAPTALELSAVGLRALDATDPAAAARRAVLLARADALAPLAERVATHPGTRWWHAPLRRDRQRWFGHGRAEGPQVTPPAGPPSEEERHEQTHRGGVWTSTDTGPITSWEVAALALDGARDDATPLGPGLRVDVASDARVREVDTAEAWHALCVEHPAALAGARASDGRAGLVPDWSRVASAWDGVHLTFHGLLTATDVRIDSDAGWTRLRGRTCEHTLWLRGRFRISGPVSVATRSQLDPGTFDDLTLPGVPVPVARTGGRSWRWRRRTAPRRRG
jgi:hypothetical protein